MPDHDTHDQQSVALLAGVLVSSDRAYEGTYEDKSGPVLQSWLQERGVRTMPTHVVSDDVKQIVDNIGRLVNIERCNVVIVCGGTGISKTDVTPQALNKLGGVWLPGFGEAMRLASANEGVKTAALSRAGATAYEDALVICIPGNPNAIATCLGAVWESVQHATDQLAL